MTQAKQRPSPNAMHELLRSMQIRMRNVALHHFDTIGLRSVVGLQNLNLLDDPTGEPLGSNLDLEVLRDPTHKHRIKLSPGPLLLYLTTDEKPKRMLFEIPVLFLSELPEVRKAVLGELRSMIDVGSLEITPKTRGVLTEFAERVLSSDPNEWRPAAIALTDAFADDVMVALQATRQSLESEPAIQESLNKYVPRVISPGVSSLNTINLSVKDPEKEHPLLTEIIVRASSGASSLREACERYYSQLGYLPLAPAYSMAEVVGRWLATHADADAWTEVWGWANVSGGPIPRYHACVVFVLHPELVPRGKLSDLWQEILAVVADSGSKIEENLDREPWALRRGLARHYAYLLEANLPDNDGAGIACFAWWLAERVARLFPDDPKSAQFYRKNWFMPAEERTMHIWLAASSRIGRSYLRYVTTTVTAPWATALLAMMGGKLDQLSPADLPAKSKSQFHDSFVSCLIGALPFVVEATAGPTYAQECPLGQTAIKWAVHQPEDQRTALEQLVATSRTLGSAEGLCEALRKMEGRSLPDQFAVALALKAKAYTDPSIATAVWAVLADPDWRQRVLGIVDDRVLGLLVEDFFLLQASAGEKWFSDLPHFLAELCEKCEDRDRCWELFLYVIHSSMASDTVSAIRRLLNSDRKALMAEFAREYRTRIEAAWTQYPAWVQGRLRAIFTSLQGA